MTVWIRDASNFDGTVSFDGLAGFTHKATEGISVVHDRYGPRLTAARDAGVPVLGAYHVLRSPSAANGSYAAQLAFWLGYLDAQTPWWRTHPNFVLQIDAERWAYDNVTAAEVLTFAALLASLGEPGWKVTYASRGQYGDSLRGIATPLWNADYRGGPAYPGDGWVSSGGSPAGWAPYSGQTPVILQYTSSGYDHNAFRGTLAELLALTSNGDPMDVLTWNTGWMLQRYFEDADPVVVPPNEAIGAPGFSIPNIPKQERLKLAADAKAAAALPTTVTMTADDQAAVASQFVAGVADKLDQGAKDVLAELAKAAAAALAVLNPPAA